MVAANRPKTILKRVKTMIKEPMHNPLFLEGKSVRNAIKSDFRPAWVEMTAKFCKTVDRMNK